MYGYILIGATVFVALERTGEMKGADAAPDRARVTLLIQLDSLHKSLSTKQKNRTSFRQAADEIIQEYDVAVAKATSEGWTYNARVDDDWSYDAAVLFSATLVTTVGYGNIAPVTSAGRMFTIIYSCIGIPLSLMCIFLMGSIMARGFKAITLFLFEDSITEDGEPYIPIKASLVVMGGYLFAGAVLFRIVGPGWTFLESLYFCFVTLSTIGLGDFVYGEGAFGKKDSSFLLSMVYITLGLALLSMCFDLLQEQALYKVNRAIFWVKKKLSECCPSIW